MKVKRNGRLSAVDEKNLHRHGFKKGRGLTGAVLQRIGEEREIIHILVPAFVVGIVIGLILGRESK